jgi:exodeoxyribonuclease V gamma subunit
LLDYLENPCAAVRGVSAPEFRDFLERAGFREGWDENNRTESGAAPGSFSTLDRAMRRVLLGLILDADDPNLIPEELWPAAEAGNADRDTLCRWLEFLDRLRRDLHPLVSGRSLSFAAWGALLQKLLSDYFSVGPERAEAPTAAALHRFFRALADWEGFTAAEASHHLILSLIEDHFRDPGGPRGSLLPGGIRIGSLETLRGLPFRRVWVLGLNGGDFPRPAASPYGGLDLRAFRRVLGESDPAGRDLYAFLETLAATSEAIALSYVRREDPDGKRHPVGASYALAALMAYLE